MDMEADLGIDSIKRVEILGAVQDIISDLPELNPEDLAELRTLGEIVSHMQGKVQSKITTIKPSTSVVTAKEAVVENTVITTPTITIDLNHIKTVMMDVVADKTGYPTEMLELGMDMEADLGIDSIKRVEILGAVQDIISDLPELNPEDLAELRTLGEIVSHMQGKVQSIVTAAPNVSATPETALQAPVSPAVTIDLAFDIENIQTVMMDVVADKTGYPTEMLELGMDMEADLGIDSIKRVEILGAVQDIITDLPELNPEDLAELRTLGEIVSYMQGKVQNKVTAIEPSTSVIAKEAIVENTVITTPTITIDLDHIQTVMMDVVADKTGYPTEMLELGMDMEADLGIDSIKRVEILGAVQDIISDLPELNPEDLAELRTLGEIVSHMQGKVQSKIDPVPPTDPTPTTTKTAKEESSTVEVITNNNQSVIENPAPSATVALQALSSVTKIVQNFMGNSIEQQPKVLIVDDGSGTAISVSAKLLKQGWQVSVLKPNWLNSNVKKAFSKSVKVIEIGTADKTLDEAQLSAILAEQGQLDAVVHIQEGNEQTIQEGNAQAIDQTIEYADAAKQGLMLAFLLAKFCNVKAAQNARATFMVVTHQGGTLGFSQNQAVKANLQADLVQGGLAGLVKTLSHEWNGQLNNETPVFCRLVDLSSKLAADKAATIICDELLDIDGSLIEVGYDTDNLSNNLASRLTLIGVPTDSYSLTASNEKLINQDSVFLVSGGAKGVTAHCVIEIAKQHQAKFILLGRSPLLASDEESEPSWASGLQDEVALKKAAMQVLIASGEKPTPVKVSDFVRPILANREIIQTLNAIKAAGGQAHYVAADVTNSDSVKAAVAPAITEFGEVTGIIHGAGVLADKFIEQKTLAEFDAVYRTKIDGLQSLLSVCQAENIKHLVLFSSAAGFYGNPGQSDYSIANEILNKTAYRFKAQYPDAQVLSFNWGPWDGGMVTPELKRMFDARGVYIIPLDAGAKLLTSELNASSNRCAQILVGNDLSKDQSTNQSTSKANDAAAEVVKGKKSLVSHLSTPVSVTPIRVIKTLQVTNNTFLADHVINQEQVLPTVCALAWMSEVALGLYPDYKAQGINDYKLLKGVTFDSEALAKAQAIDFTVEMSNAGLSAEPSIAKNENELLLNCKISSLNETTGKTVFHYSAQLVLTSNSVQTNSVQKSSGQKSSVQKDNAVVDVDNQFINGVAAKLTEKSANEAAELYQNGTLFHGESLQGITHLIDCNESGLLLSCKVPSIALQKQGEFMVNAASNNSASNANNNSFANIFANDLAYQAMLVWAKRELGLGSLPSSTQAWQVYGQLEVNQTFYLQLTVVKATGKGGKRGSLVADINFISESGQILAEIKSAKVTASASLNEMFLPVETTGITD
ncbi:SDR family NAD(P)-dependent oxidoreductase, partial [Colwellia sp. E2M01]|uniref:SDR family NAD(P)-dependent oxidoreductase n=1 Tax=Colwellia sp. E2M01 TaxID=2841561 RepID=UPI001C088AD6